jgi:energy-coupling factor transport system ATP-binding protein
MNSLLRAEGVGFAYIQDGRGIGTISLELGAGEVVHICGLSGCGKSTLARCLTGLVPHLYRGQLDGTVWLCGQRTDQAPLWQLTEAAGMVFQNPATQMLSSTVEDEIIFGLENLGLPVAEIEQRTTQALEDFGLAEMRARSPLTLSGGEQQKLALAAVMARRPPLLVLDEPLSMLDTTAALDLVERLAQLAAQGVAVVICEHRQEYLAGLPGLRTISLESLYRQAGAAAELSWPGTVPACLERPVACLEAGGLQVARGGRMILNSWDFSLRGGEMTAVVGRNGVGKTTLFRALAGLQQYSGALQVQPGREAERPQLGMVFQNPDLQLFNASVRDEVLYGVPAADMQLYAWLLDVLDLRRYEDTPPLLLSEGEKRRVALATILMHQPRHGVLLDEPALGQDYTHKEMLVHLLRTLAQASQIVAYSTHDVELALQADRLVLLGPQGIIVSGPPGDLLARQDAWLQAGLRLPDWVCTAC